MHVISKENTGIGKQKQGYYRVIIRKEIPTVVHIYLAGWRRRAFRNSGREVTEVNWGARQFHRVPMLCRKREEENRP